MCGQQCLASLCPLSVPSCFCGVTKGQVTICTLARWPGQEWAFVRLRRVASGPSTGTQRGDQCPEGRVAESRHGVEVTC